MPKITFEIDITKEDWEEFHENSLMCHDKTGAERLRELLLVDNVRHKMEGANHVD